MTEGDHWYSGLWVLILVEVFQRGFKRKLICDAIKQNESEVEKFSFCLFVCFCFCLFCFLTFSIRILFKL